MLRSASVSDELRKVAATPFAVSASTWSFISAISGEITTVSPGRTSAGSWKHSDLPPPVGKSAKTSRPSSDARMMPSCNDRKLP